ncbi:hypothetical protein TNCV_352831 [Trichonephila clavipes]|nr:hypothetical protein TNCV_352831 [Trichonephila clavipes]
MRWGGSMDMVEAWSSTESRFSRIVPSGEQEPINSFRSLDDVIHWSRSTVTILSNPWTMSCTGVLQL